MKKGETEKLYQPDFKECLQIALDQQSTFEGMKGLLSEDYPNSALRTLEKAAELYLNFNKKAYALSCIEASLIKAAENGMVKHCNWKDKDSEQIVTLEVANSLYAPKYFVRVQKDSITNPSNHVLL